VFDVHRGVIADESAARNESPDQVDVFTRAYLSIESADF